MRRHLFLILSLCTLALGAGCDRKSANATSAGPVTVTADLSTPTKAAASLAAAVNAGDMHAVATCITGTDADVQMLQLIHDMGAAADRYNAVAVAKFGSAGKLDEWGLGWKLPTQWNTATEQITGDTATVTTQYAPNHLHKSTLKKQADGWKVDVSKMAADPTSQQMLKNKLQILSAYDATAKKIDAGGYRSAEAAQHAVQLAIANAVSG